uniref:Protein CREG1 n=2 Tax=Endopterygota TaxID=33392 RepID=A0A034V9Q0_BACDO
MSQAIAIISGLLFALLAVDSCAGYSAHGRQPSGLSDAALARRLVHQANWAAVGSISTHEKIIDFPMVNIMAVDDSALNGSSTGHIRFFLLNLDFTGRDTQQKNKVTFFFTDDQNGACQRRGVDPMEPACPRVMLSGSVKKLDAEDPSYNDQLQAFYNRHKSAEKWAAHSHNFDFSELEIENIFIVAYQGGPRVIPAEDYYNATI